MIGEIEQAKDKAGFPVVTWTETRGISAPAGPGTARVECGIMKDAATGTLLLVARGAKRVGGFEAGKPWQSLRSFSVQAAEGLYYTKAELDVRRYLANKGLGSKLAWSDGGQVVLADFAGDSPLHLNYAEASPVDLDRLHVALTRAFVGRQELVAELCRDEMYRWPLTDERVPSYDPDSRGGPSERQLRPVVDALLWVLAIAIVGGGLGLVLWLLRVI